MRRAYLLIALPALIIGVCYFVVFRSLGLTLQSAPFLGAAGGFAAAVLLVRFYLRRHGRRPGG
jgi:hypothetical protein